MKLRRTLRRVAVEGLLGLIQLPVSLVAQFAKREPIKTPQRILVIRLDLLGDVALTLPAVRSLRLAYPLAQIDMLVRPAAMAIAAHCPDIDHVLSYDIDALRPSGRPLARSSWQALWSLVRTLQAEHYDLAIGVFGAWASLVALASGAPARVGFRREGFRGVYSVPVGGRRYRPIRHERAYGLRLARAAGGVSNPEGPFLTITDIERNEALRLLSPAVGKGPLIIVSAGSSAADAKRWTVEGWVGLIDDAMARNCRVVLVGGPTEATLAETIATQTTQRPLVLAGSTTLDQLIAVLACADLVVAGDTGPLHIAEALGRPVVAIHGPSNPAISGPLNPASRFVRMDLPCSPCYDATYAAQCPLGHHKCMVDLPSSLVTNAAFATLGQPA